MRRYRRAFTLMEALISLALMSVLLGVVASLMRDVSILMRQIDTNQVEVIRSVLDHVARDVRSAYQIKQCDALAVEVLCLDPWDEARIPNPLPDPLPSTFLPHANASSKTVRYALKNNSLFCATVYPDKSKEEIEVAADISGFDGRFVDPGLVELSASMTDTKSTPTKIISLRTLVMLHLPVQVVQ